ncbi:hypothetical protein QCA50_010339 [Cerrena zonata]|uniref:Uncharacterized protein n=1 Tax=Cerrena zonata TaxID=2478898 RepID=A0AAW0G936_9APHY
MLTCYCPLTRLHMLFRLVPWKAIWANGSLEFIGFGLRYVVIVISNALLALAWLGLSIVCAFNNLVRLVLRIPPEHPSACATPPERVGNRRRARRKVKRSDPLPRTTSSPHPPTKSAVRTGHPAVARHVSFTREDRETHISHTVSAPPVRVKSNERLTLSVSPVVEETERGESTASSTASPDSISPIPTLELDSVTSSRSVSPDRLLSGEGKKSQGRCRNIVNRRRTTDELKKAPPPRRRTDPYQAPYFFPTPLSPGAEDYVRIVRAERARLSISPTGSPSRKPSQLITEPLPTLPSATIVPGGQLKLTSPEPLSRKRPGFSRRNAAGTTPSGSRETSPSPSPRSRDRGKKHLQFFKGFSHSSKRSNSPPPLDGAAHSDDNVSAGRLRKSSRRSSRLRRMLSRSHDEETLRESVQRVAETQPRGPEVVIPVKEARNSREHRHSWHSVFHPRRSLSMTSQDSASFGQEDSKVHLSQVDELSSATLSKKRR